MAKKKVKPEKIIGKTLTRLMEKSPILNTQAALASASGVAQTTIGRIMRSEVNPTADNLRKLAEALGTETTIFFTGIDQDQIPRPILAWEHDDSLPEGDVALIPCIAVTPTSDASNRIKIKMDETKPWPVPTGWIRKLGIKPDQLAYIKAEGPSMEGLIHDGDTVVIDTSQKDVVDGKVFEIWYDGGARVKRLYRLPGGGLRIKSDNPDFAPIDLMPGQLEHVHIIGRVVHVAGEGGL